MLAAYIHTAGSACSFLSPFPPFKKEAGLGILSRVWKPVEGGATRHWDNIGRIPGAPYDRKAPEDPRVKGATWAGPTDPSASHVTDDPEPESSLPPPAVLSPPDLCDTRCAPLRSKLGAWAQERPQSELARQRVTPATARIPSCSFREMVGEHKVHGSQQGTEKAANPRARHVGDNRPEAFGLAWAQTR